MPMEDSFLTKSSNGFYNSLMGKNLDEISWEGGVECSSTLV